MRLLSVSGLFAVIVGLYAPSSAAASGTSFLFGTQGCGQVTTSVVTCNANATIFNAQAEGSLTTLRVSMDFSAVNVSGPNLTAVGGGVTVFDSITMTGGVPGSTGTLRVNWAVSGTLATNGAFDITIAELDYYNLPQCLGGSCTSWTEWRACGAINPSCASFSGSP